jgi:hypothetical protein
MVKFMKENRDFTQKHNVLPLFKNSSRL